MAKYAYADPPYPGCAHLYPENTEVDHVELIARLQSDYPDGWALSTGSVQLQYVLGLCPPNVRVAAWVKPFANYKPNVNPAYAWEPVIWCGGRSGRPRHEATVCDWVAASITMRRGIVGAKPDGFWWWMLDLLGFEDGDSIDDLFPGTGRFGHIIEAHRRQLRIEYSIPTRRRRLIPSAPKSIREAESSSEDVSRELLDASDDSRGEGNLE